MIKVMTATQRVLITGRLRLEPLNTRHAAAIAGLFADPALSAYLAADFTQRDLSELQGLNQSLERLLTLCQTADKSA